MREFAHWSKYPTHATVSKQFQQAAQGQVTQNQQQDNSECHYIIGIIALARNNETAEVTGGKEFKPLLCF